MNYQNLCFSILILLLLSCRNTNTPVLFDTTETYPEQLQQLHRNAINYFLEDEIDLEEVSEVYNNLNENGTWPDIDYPSKTRGHWSPRYHLARMMLLAKAYQKPGTEFYQKPKVSAKIHAALNHWLNNDFQSPNWRHPVIGTPMRLLPTLLLMEPELSVLGLEKGARNHHIAG